METEIPPANMGKLLREKAEELFAVCDREDKGFIAKMDMQRLLGELPLGPDQLEDVFDTLDEDGNGYLTLEEFTDGFGLFLGLDPSQFKTPQPDHHSSLQRDSETEDNEEDEEEEQFNDLMDHLGAQNLFQDEDVVKSMWCHLRKQDPALVLNFEGFLQQISDELHVKRAEHNTLEEALRIKNESHDDQVKKLYEEMEVQIRTEKEKAVSEERKRERKLKEELEEELKQKDQQLHEMMTQHQKLKTDLLRINSSEIESKQENARLMKEKDKLEQKLRRQEKTVSELHETLEHINIATRDEKRKRAKAALQVSEGIATEREGLVMQLDMLRQINSNLLDQKDERLLESQYNSTGEGERMSEVLGYAEEEDKENDPIETLAEEEDIPLLNLPPFLKPIPAPRQNSYQSSSGVSTMSVSSQSRRSASPATMSQYDMADCECDDEYFENNPDLIPPLSRQQGREKPRRPNSLKQWSTSVPQDDTQSLFEELMTQDGEMDKLPSPMVQKGMFPDDMPYTSESEGDWTTDNEELERRRHKRSKGHKRDYSNHSSTLMIYNNPRNKTGETENKATSSPERVFKVVVIGDSGVGKSSLINRFCRDIFKPSYSATIGVDFQIQSVRVGDRTVCIQMWDTAGQERFRCITKQYYRKADGIIILYDVTSETSFKNVRGWINSAKEGIDENAIVVLVGNKTDLCESDADRVVKTRDGERLAEESGALFFEASAKSGKNVFAAIEQMATVLQEKQDTEIENTVKLQVSEQKKKPCC